jgi:hypothetical protein
MKIVFHLCIALVLWQMTLGHSWAQKGKRRNEPGPRTILWKITDARCPKPSYLLGTFHLSDAEWLLKTPQMAQVVDSTEYILSEQFTTQPSPATTKREILKALPLLDKKQFETLDSFFVARLGEGIRDNPDASAMTVAEMESAIVVTLVSGNDKANAITKYIDKDLFELYVKLGRQGDRLDREKVTDFDSSEIDHARQYLSRAVNYTHGSDKPDWNIYGTPAVEDTLARYKAMQFEYHLEEPSPKMQAAPYFDFVPFDQRNKEWMPKIVSVISSKPTLIAVGLAHLYYKTGLITLLRAEGYRVEPVMFH